MKLKKIIATLAFAFTIITTVPTNIKAAISPQELIIQKANSLLNEALTEETFYKFNMAYAEILKIQNGTTQAQFLDKLATLQEKVWTSDIANYVALLQQLTNTGSGKIYDQTEALIRNSQSIKFVDKEYLLGEITGWGWRLVYTRDYIEAVDSVVVAWSNINSENIAIADSKINGVINSYSKAYLQEEIAKIKAILSKNEREINYNEEGIPVVGSFESYKTLLKSALKNFDSGMKIEIEGYSEDLYNLSAINDILTEDPRLNYGYSGASANMTWFGDGSVRTVDIVFHYEKSKDEMIIMKTAVEQKSKEILSSIIKADMKDYEKEKAIHDYVVNNSRYDIEIFNNNTVPMESYTDYGVLIKGVGVCDGYARAMFRLLNEAGIKSLYVTGTADGNGHAWNLVQLGGAYYHLDATWDDPVSSRGSILSYDYFNVTDSFIAKDHIWDKSKYPAATATTYSYNNIK